MRLSEYRAHYSVWAVLASPLVLGAGTAATATTLTLTLNLMPTQTLTLTLALALTLTLLLGADLRTIERDHPDCLALLKNRHIVAVNQDPAARPNPNPNPKLTLTLTITLT